MSCVNILVQRRSGAAHILSDGAAYIPSTGELTQILQKTFPVPTLHMAVASVGKPHISMFFASALDRRFSTFDEVIQFAPEVMPELFETFVDVQDADDSEGQMFFAGWLQDEGRPACFAMSYRGERSTRWSEITRGGAIRGSTPMELVEWDLAGTPSVSEGRRSAAGLYFSDPETATPLDLLHLMEVQRRPPHGPSYVGGHALHTMITKDSITQRVIHRWHEDKIGEPIRPEPIDYKAWRSARESESAAPQATRLRREMMERKAKKAARRSEQRR